MELLPLVCLCVLTWSGTTFAGPEIIRLTEGSDVTLPCSVSVDVSSKKFVWMKDGQKEVFVYDSGLASSEGLSGQHEQFKRRVSYFDGELKNGNASISIRNTKVSDSGNYTCELKLTPNQKFHIRLLVGAAPKPSVTILDQTKDWALLRCEVHGASSQPKVQWKDSDENILNDEKPQVIERGGGGYDVILQIKVTKADYYRCVSTQEEINHQVHSEIYVHLIDGPLSDRKIPDVSGSTTGRDVTIAVVGAVVGSVLVTLVVVVVILLVLIKKDIITINCSRGRSKTRVPREEPNH